mgnify:CR=1 FL=1
MKYKVKLFIVTENQFIVNLFPYWTNHIWIGVHDGGKNDYFIGVDGSKIDFSPWAKNEPTHKWRGHDEDAVEIYGKGHDQYGKWNDASKWRVNVFACVYNIESSKLRNKISLIKVIRYL